MSRAKPEPMARPRTRTAVTRVLVLIGVLTGATFIASRMGWLDARHVLAVIAQLRHSENAGAFIAGFIAIYALGTALGLPGLPFNSVAGAVFGGVTGGVIAWVGSMVGAVLGYWVARTVGRREVLRWVGRFRRADAAVEQARDFPGLLRLRLFPVLPIGAVNFIAGLARARFGAYLVATALGILPSVVIYSYFAESLVAGVGTGRRDALITLAMASAALITLSLLPKYLRSRDRRDRDQSVA
jgi:uncharacterized membrane protein YdjX (TVP38/TMEM64 family)